MLASTKYFFNSNITFQNRRGTAIFCFESERLDSVAYKPCVLGLDEVQNSPASFPFGKPALVWFPLETIPGQFSTSSKPCVLKNGVFSPARIDEVKPALVWFPKETIPGQFSTKSKPYKPDTILAGKENPFNLIYQLFLANFELQYNL